MAIFSQTCNNKGLSTVALLLFVFTLLDLGSYNHHPYQGAVMASEKLDKLIRDVAVSDDHFYNDVYPEVIPARAVLGNDIINVTFKVGRGYRGRIIDEEKEIFEERLESFEKSGVYLTQEDEDGGVCRVEVVGQQLVRNYVRFYRAQKEVEMGKPSFVKLRLTSGKTRVLVPLLQTVQISKESLFKYLPYQLNQLVDLFSFTVTYDLQATHYVNYEMTVSSACLPPDINRFATLGDKNDTNLPRVPSTTDYSRSTLDSLPMKSDDSAKTHSCNPNLLDDHDNAMPCYDVIDDVSGRRRHLFMLLIQMQNLFMNRFHGGEVDDTEVCAVRLKVGPASGTGVEPQPTLIECCHVLLGRQKLFRKGEEEHGWNCHQPYKFSGLILAAVGYVSYIAWLMLPLSIASLPADLHRAGNGQQERRNQAVQEEQGEQGKASSRKASRTSETKPMRHAGRTSSRDDWTPISMTPDSLSLDGIEDGRPNSKPSQAQLLQALPHDLIPYPYQGTKYLGDPWAPAPRKIPTCGLVFINDDPVYHFTIGTLFYYGLLFHVKSHHLVVARRFLFLYSVWMLQQLGALQFYVYYPFLYEYVPAVQWPSKVWFHMYPPESALGNEHQYHIALIVHLLIIPAALAVVQFVLLSPLLSSRTALAEMLYWEECDTAIGSHVGIDQEDNVYDFNLSYEDRIQRNLYARLQCVSKLEFWIYLFRFAVFRVKQDNCGLLIYGLKAMVKIVIIPLIFPFYVLPIFTFFYVLFRRDNKAEFNLRNSLRKWGTQLMIFLGIGGLFFMFLPFLFFIICLFIFVLLDTIRNIADTLTQLIFLMSIMANIKSTFSDLEDEYRTVKNSLFHVLEELEQSDDEQDKSVTGILLWRGNEGELAIPRPLFDHVCRLQLPLGERILQALQSLFTTLLCFGLLYAVIVQYQIFDQFSQTGESIITVVFVSLPSLLGGEKTEAQSELDSKEHMLKMRAVLRKVLGSVDFWASFHRNGRAGGLDEEETYVTSV